MKERIPASMAVLVAVVMGCSARQPAGAVDAQADVNAARVDAPVGVDAARVDAPAGVDTAEQVLPPVDLDSDTDGVPDHEELADGTDPLDPSSARAWQPDWIGHPRLLFGPEDLEEIRAKVASTKEPFATLVGRLEARLSGETPDHPLGDYDPYLATGRARIAKAAAFLALVRGDAELAARAVRAPAWRARKGSLGGRRPRATARQRVPAQSAGRISVAGQRLHQLR